MRAIFCPGPSYADPKVREVAGWVRILDLYREALEELGYQVVIPEVDPALLQGTSGVSRVLAYGVAAAAATQGKTADLILCAPSYGLPTMMAHRGAAKLTYVWNNESTYRHSMLEPEHKARGLAYDTTPTDTWLNHSGLRMADHVLANSHFVKGTHARVVPADKISIAFWGVDSHIFSPPPEEPPAYRILFVGGDAIRKGLTYLVEAFVKLLEHQIAENQEIPEPELWIVGVWLRVNSPNMKTFGMVPHAQMAEIMRQCHVLVLASLEDGNPLCVQEAMASGMPVVTTPVASEVYEDGASGIQVPYRDPGAIREALVRLADPAVRRPMAAAARALAETQTWGRTKEAVKEVVRRVVEGGPLPFESSRG